MRSFVRSALAASLLALAAAAAGALAGCGGSGHSIKQTSRAPAHEYVIGAEDVIDVVVWKEPDLTRSITVRPDGRITVPIAGELQAEGKTARQLEKVIAAALVQRIADPVVTVTVKEINSARVFVLGEVGKPGAYPLRGNMSVLQVLALAGGLTEFADGDDITVLRRTAAGKEDKLRFSYSAAVRGDLFDLAPGDTVIVP